MRKFLIPLIAGIFGALLAVGGITIYDNYRGETHMNDTAIMQYVDSVAASHVADYSNPVFDDIDAVITYRDFALDDKSMDEVFLSMPDQDLSNVARVLINREGKFSKRELVLEYLDHPDIYPNLGNTDAEEVNKAATDLGIRSDSAVLSREFKYRTDTINGKPTKVRIMTEEKIE